MKKTAPNRHGDPWGHAQEMVSIPVHQSSENFHSSKINQLLPCVAVCEKPLEHYTIAAKYTREEFVGENKEECEDKCKKPQCETFDFTAGKK